MQHEETVDQLLTKIWDSSLLWNNKSEFKNLSVLKKTADLNWETLYRAWRGRCVCIMAFLTGFKPTSVLYFSFGVRSWKVWKPITKISMKSNIFPSKKHDHFTLIGKPNYELHKHFRAYWEEHANLFLNHKSNQNACQNYSEITRFFKKSVRFSGTTNFKWPCQTKQQQKKSSLGILKRKKPTSINNNY